MANTGISSFAKTTFGSLRNRILPSSGKSIELGSPKKFVFRPAVQPPTQSTTPQGSPSSISGLRFCLHMVIFAVPGVVLAKKLCDGEKLEDIVEHTKETMVSLIPKTS